MAGRSSVPDLHIFPYDEGRFVVFHPTTKIFFRAGSGTADVLRRLTRHESERSIAQELGVDSAQVKETARLCRAQIQARHDSFPEGPGKAGEDRTCGKLSFHVSNDCNMRCKYCYASGGAYGLAKDRMSVQTSLAILSRFYSAFDEINEIMFFGGEPLLNFPAIEAVCEYLAERSRRDPARRMPQLGMVTNLSAIPRGLPQLIRQYALSITVSLDGPAGVHDQNRLFISGRGTHAVVSRNIKKLKELTGEPSMIEATYTQQHAERGISCRDLLSYFHSEFGILQAEIADVSVADDHPCRVPESFVGRLVQEQDATVNEMIDALADGHQAAGLNELHCTLGLLLSDPRPFDVHCNAGIHQYAVSTTGDLYPCHMFVGEKQLCMGNIFEEKAFESQGMKNVRRMLLNAAKSRGRCSTCWARNLCMGCVARCWHEQGDISFSQRADCRRIRRSLEGLLGRLARVSESPQRLQNLINGLQKRKPAEQQQ